MDLRELDCRIVEWICGAQNRDRWQALVNMVINVQVLAPS
jgi:hypothetical protein